MQVSCGISLALIYYGYGLSHTGYIWNAPCRWSANHYKFLNEISTFVYIL